MVWTALKAELPEEAGRPPPDERPPLGAATEEVMLGTMEEPAASEDSGALLGAELETGAAIEEGAADDDSGTTTEGMGSEAGADGIGAA